MQPQNYLFELLSDPDLSAHQFFSNKGIIGHIRPQMQTFIDFCIRNQKFTEQMVKLGLQQQSYASEEQKKVAYSAAQFLTCDQDSIADIFVIDKSKERIRLYSDDDDGEQVCQEIIEDNQTGQLTIADRQTSEDKSDFYYKYRHLIKMLEYLNTNELDENCVNYTSKVFNTVVRIKPEEIFDFLVERVDVLQRIVELTIYPSISFVLVKLVNEEIDEKYRKHKTEIIKTMIQQIKKRIESNNFAIYLEFIEQIFNKNRFRGEEMDEIKIISQQLVEKDIIEFMKEQIKTSESTIVIFNCIQYLLKVVERMNVDEEKDPYSYSSDRNLEPTMNFATEAIYQMLEPLLLLSSKINRQNYTPFQIFTYYELLKNMTKHSSFDKTQYSPQKIEEFIYALLNAFEKEGANKNGLIKNQILYILELIIKKKNLNNIFSTQIYEKSSRLCQYSARDGFSYCDKLRIMINPIDTGHYLDKYTQILSPNNYTSNRQYKVPQLEFINNKKKQLSKQNNDQNSNSMPPPLIINQNNSQEDYYSPDFGSDSPGSLGQSPSSGKNLNLNLNTLNSKIKAIKQRKRSKQNDDLGACRPKQLNIMPDSLPQQNSDEEDEGRKTQFQKESVKCSSQTQTKTIASYYVKHIDLF